MMPDEFDDMPSLPSPPRESAGPALRRAHLSRVVGHVYRAAPTSLRGRILECLLRPVGPLAMLAVASGAFARHLRPQGRSNLHFGVDELASYTLDQVADLAQFVEQVSPETIQQLSSLLTDSPAGLVGFGAAAALVLVRRLMRQTGP